jgi:hypothetical protein
MRELKKVLYGTIKSIEYLDSVMYPGTATCLVELYVPDFVHGRYEEPDWSVITVYDRSSGRFEKKHKVGDRVSLECVVEYPRSGLRRYLYYGANRAAS